MATTMDTKYKLMDKIYEKIENATIEELDRLVSMLHWLSRIEK